MRSLIFSSTTLVLSALVCGHPHKRTTPTVQVTNGSYAGVYVPEYGTDHFLGIPFAQPPIGELRYRVPQSLNTTWSGLREATAYSPICYPSGASVDGMSVSEDCLYLNVIRPAGYENQSLPVAFWIYGGGLAAGAASDLEYNLTFIVQKSVEIGAPIIGVSINYRLSSWGFLYSHELQDTGNTNLGFRDQRLALHWVQENIAAFGGDPDQVTIWGQSSGGTSVAAQILAYNGRNDNLFARGIAESGPYVALTPYANASEWQVVYDNITEAVGCSTAADTLACLRTISTDLLNSVINSSATAGAGFFEPLQYGFVIDGDFFQKPASLQLQEGEFVRVPVIIGTNRDEGTSQGKTGINTTAEFMAYLHEKRSFDDATVSDLSLLYPDIPDVQPPFTMSGRPAADSGLGLQYRRVAAFAGDFGQHGSARLTSIAYAAYNTTVYKYLFDVLANGISYTSGSNHAEELPFVFNNLEGVGYSPNPLGGGDAEKLLYVADLMSRMWIGFFTTGDPNSLVGSEFLDNGYETWVPYTSDAPNHYYFSENETSHMELDGYRAPGIAYLNDLMLVAGAGNCTGLVDCGATSEFLYGSSGGLWGW